MWFEALERASRQFYTMKNPHAMLDILYPLHRIINPEQGNPRAEQNLTPQEKSFKNLNGSDLSEAFELCQVGPDRIRKYWSLIG